MVGLLVGRKGALRTGFWGFGRLFGVGEGFDNGFAEKAVAAGGDAFKGERTQADALHFFDGMAFAEEHAAEHVHFCTEHAYLIPEIGSVTTGGVGLANGAEFGAGFLTEAFKFFEGEAALDLDVVELRKIRPVFEHLRGEAAVVGEQDEATGGVVEAADGINALGKTAKEIAKGFAAFGIGERGDHIGRLVHDEINGAFLGFDSVASGLDFVFGRVRFGAEFGYGFAVDANLAGEDELLGVAAGSDAGVGDNFLEAFEHLSCQFSVLSYQLAE